MYSAHASFRAALAAIVSTAAFHLGLPDALAGGTPDLRNLLFIPVPVAGETAAPVRTPPPIPPTGPADGGAAAPEPGIEDYLAGIRQAEDREGPWAESIAQSSLALAGLYRRAGRPREALEALEKALQVTRVNKGLFDTSQIAILRQMIDTLLQLGDLEKAHAKEEYLFYLQRKNYHGNDPRLLAAIIEWADWNVNMHLRERSLGLAQPYIPRDSFQPGPPLISPRLQHAKDLYHVALEWLHGSGVEDPRVVTTERKLAALNYLIDQELNEAPASPPASVSGDFSYPRDEPGLGSFQFQEGSDALKRAIAYSYNSPHREYGSIAERIMELGDWYLLFDRRAAALETYEEALAVLSASAMSAQEIERIMTPGMPVRIPEIHSLEDAAAPPPGGYKGYIDVEFTLSRFGLASSPTVIGSSPGSPRAVERELFKTIHDCRFRPKFAEGGVASEEKVRLRYYYTY